MRRCLAAPVKTGWEPLGRLGLLGFVGLSGLSGLLVPTPPNRPIRHHPRRLRRCTTPLHFPFWPTKGQDQGAAGCRAARRRSTHHRAQKRLGDYNDPLKSLFQIVVALTGIFVAPSPRYAEFRGIPAPATHPMYAYAPSIGAANCSQGIGKGYTAGTGRCWQTWARFRLP